MTMSFDEIKPLELSEQEKDSAIFFYTFLYAESGNWGLTDFVNKLGKVRGIELWAKFKNKKDVLSFFFTECTTEEIKALLS